MSLFDTSNFITIKLYYIMKDVSGNKKLIILDDDKGQKQFKEQAEDAKNKVEMIETKWNNLNWREQNEISTVSSKDIDPMTGERQFNLIVYRDSLIKKCLKEWNLTMNGNAVPVTSDNIGKLPSNIVYSLYKKFENITTYTEEDLKN
ncbi:MAG: hypothetical protein J7L15_04010 [Clostridiales bacterium]|nr:hypothetical protein [Clostridiales bacterium]